MKLRYKILLYTMTVVDLTLWYTFMVWSYGAVTFDDSYLDNHKFLKDIGWI